MKRVAVFDNIKFFLIILMVYGHLMNIGCNVPWPVYKIIYSFHIPLFVLISGYFTKKQDKNFHYSILNLFLLYVIFCAISWGINIFIYHKPAFQAFYQTPFALWYILCLIYWKSIIRFTPEAILKSWWFLIAGMVVSVLPLLIELDYFSIARCFSFFPFFLIGWWVRENKLVEKLDKIIAPPSQRVILQSSLFFITLICCYIATKIPTGFYWGLHPVEYPLLLVIGCKVATWIIAVVNSLAVYIFMPKNKEISEGQNTLFYYLYHTILLYPVFDIINDYLPNTILMSVVVLAGVMVTLYSMARIPLLKKILVVGKKH